MMYEVDTKGNEISKQIIISHASTSDRSRLEEFIKQKAQEHNVKHIEYTDERIKEYFSDEIKNNFVLKRWLPMWRWLPTINFFHLYIKL